MRLLQTISKGRLASCECRCIGRHFIAIPPSNIWLFADQLVSWHSRISSPAEAIRRGLPWHRWHWPAPSSRAWPGSSSCTRRRPTYLVSAVIVGSRLVATSCVISGWIVPGGRLVEISGVESGKTAPLPFLGAGGWDLILLHFS